MLDLELNRWLDWPSLPVNNKEDKIIFRARHAGVTWLYSFEDRADLNAARTGAQRLGLSLSQLLCESHTQEEKSSQ
jgi:hypothetical protein